RLGSTADGAVQRAHHDLLRATGRQRLAANLPATRFREPESTSIHASILPRVMISVMGAWYAVKAGMVFGAIMLVAFASIRTNHPHPRFGPANQITTVRAMLVALVAGLVGERSLQAAGTGAAAASLIVTA